MPRYFQLTPVPEGNLQPRGNAHVLTDSSKILKKLGMDSQTMGGASVCYCGFPVNFLWGYTAHVITNFHCKL